MNFKKTYEKYDKEFTQLWNEYVALHKQLDEFRGIDLTDELVLKINPLISKIQDKYAELYPAIHNVIERHRLCSQAMQDYQEFIEHIKQGGAVVDQEAQA